MRKLQDSAVEESSKLDSGFYEAVLDVRTASELGILTSWIGNGGLHVDEVVRGAVQRWNREHPSRKVAVGHIITAANGLPVTADSRLLSMALNGKLVLRIWSHERRQMALSGQLRHSKLRASLEGVRGAGFTGFRSPPGAAGFRRPSLSPRHCESPLSSPGAQLSMELPSHPRAQSSTPTGAARRPSTATGAAGNDILDVQEQATANHSEAPEALEAPEAPKRPSTATGTAGKEILDVQRLAQLESKVDTGLADTQRQVDTGLADTQRQVDTGLSNGQKLPVCKAVTLASLEAASVDWSLIEARMFLGDGDDLEAKRNRVFKQLDPNGSGSISLSEAQGGLPHLFEAKFGESAKSWKHPSGKAAYLVPIKDFRPAVKCAFKSASDLTGSAVTASGKRRRHKAGAETTVEKREFHAFLMALRLYLELDVLFSSVDASGDRELDYQEVTKMVPLLDKWGIDQERVDQLPEFENQDTGRMRFEAFAQMCINRRMFLDRKGGSTMLKRLDDDDNNDDDDEAKWDKMFGSPSQLTRSVSEARARVRRGGSGAQESQAAEVQRSHTSAPTAAFQASTVVTLHKVCNGVLGEDAMSMPRAEAMVAFNNKMTEVREAFNKFDEDHNGQISRDELTWLLQKLAKGVTRKEVRELYDAADNDKDGSLDIDEFVAFIFRGLPK